MEKAQTTFVAAVADSLLGVPETVARAICVDLSTCAASEVYLFVLDNWKANSCAAINWGVRSVASRG